MVDGEVGGDEGKGVGGEGVRWNIYLSIRDRYNGRTFEQAEDGICYWR